MYVLSRVTVAPLAPFERTGEAQG